MGNVYIKRWHKRLHQATRWVLIALAVAGSTLCWQCTGKEKGEPTVAAYYWSTVFGLDSTQLAFIQEQKIGRLYLRYFDVVMRNGEPMPNATVQIQAKKPGGLEVVPTVYIVNNCMEADHPQLDSLLLGRILQMSETHDLGPVREIQLDCDWTKQTQGNYFNLLRRLRERAKRHGISISATIRLHQLAQAVPPVDRGVLMMYNTGNITKFEGSNPILDMKDVKPYLRYLPDYDLPLATAYPVFAMRVVFREKENGGKKERKDVPSSMFHVQWRFAGIIHHDEYLPILPTDTIVERQAAPDMVRRVRQAIDSLRPDAHDEVIIYDISKQNIQRIKQYHYEKVICHPVADRGSLSQ